MRSRLGLPAILAAAMLLGGCGVTADSAISPSAQSASATASASPAAQPSPTGSYAPTEAPEALAWQPLDASGPTAREDHTWTVIGDGRTALLFGGHDGATVHGDLWSYDLRDETWTALDVAGGPAPRFGHEAVWVDGIGLVIYAGQAGSVFFDDLWAYDPDAETWTPLPAGGDVPIARYGTCAALGPDARLWISHGFTSEQARFSDTRAYDFATRAWADETPASGARPVERCLHGCWWTDDGDLTLYAGQTTGTPALADRWLLEDGSWTEVHGELPPERNLYARARLDGATLVFGGQALDLSYRADLWLLADGSADAVEVSVDGAAPPGRAGAEMISDVEGGRFLLFGGRGAAGSLDDLWSLSGTLPDR